MFEKNVSLKEISHYKIGGKAKYFFEAKNIDDLILAVSKARQMNEQIFILGGATNVLFDDNGFEGLVIKLNFQNLSIKENEIIAGASVLVSQMLHCSIENNLSGLEWAGGLPGTLGGAIRGNAGAFGGEMRNVVEEVVVLDISQTPKIIKLQKDECEFDYRSSIFKKNKDKIIIEATLRFEKGDGQKIKKITEQNIKYRLQNHPMEFPSLGSTFKNVPISQFKNIPEHFPVKSDPFPIVPVAYLIAEAGLKGVCVGGAMVSPKQPNFIINTGNASSSDVKNLIQLVKDKIKNKFNIDLEEEIEYL